MDHATLDSSREVFSSLQLPQINKEYAFYLLHTSQLADEGEGLEEVLESLGLDKKRFVSADEYRWSLAQGGAWMWEEYRKDLPDQSPERRISAASSLHGLLSEFSIPGREKEQQFAISLYGEFFMGCSLCFQDHLGTADSAQSVAEFLGQEENKDAFFGDKADMQRAKERDELWTMAGEGKLRYAASTLQGVLLRAWDHEPRLVTARRMEAQIPRAEDVAPSLRPKVGRF